MTSPRYLTTQEVARILGVTTAALGKYRKEESGPPWKRRGLGGDYLYPVEALREWISDNDVAVIEDLPEPEQAAAGE